MEAPGLRLIDTEDREGGGSRRALAPTAMGAFVLVTAVLATLFGADAARQAVEPTDAAGEALTLALRLGTDDAEVRAALVELRRTLGRRPLDTRTRVVYASLLLGLSSSAEEIAVAAFHAQRAAELSPVTVPVARTAALVLAHAGKLEESAVLIRNMFDYDPERAAMLLAEVEARVLGPKLDFGIPETPEAWMAWTRQLGRDARTAEAEVWLSRTHRRWPDHLPAHIQLASAAFYARDWATFETLFPPDLLIPEVPAAAVLLTWNARARLRRGDGAGALGDVERALRLGDRDIVTLTYAGDVLEELEDHARARHAWNRALHLQGASPGAEGLLRRLARLEDRYGEPASALRHWRALLLIHPDHAEARRRVEDLSGFRR